jgi:hypothetical protein
MPVMGCLLLGRSRGGYRDILLEPDGRLEQILCEHTLRGWLAAWPKPSEGVGCLIVSSEDMVELEAVELLLQVSNLLEVCSHEWVTIVWLSHNLIDDELRVSTDVKLLNPKFSCNAQSVDQCLVVHHIVSGMEV